MRMRVSLLVATVFAAALAGCATQPTAQQPQSSGRTAIYMYAFEEPGGPGTVIKHSLFLSGEGPTGQARYTAAAFKDGTRATLPTSGTGTYTINGSEITVKAGGLDAKGTIRPGEAVQFGAKRYGFAMKI